MKVEMVLLSQASGMGQHRWRGAFAPTRNPPAAQPNGWGASSRCCCRAAHTASLKAKPTHGVEGLGFRVLGLKVLGFRV